LIVARNHSILRGGILIKKEQLKYIRVTAILFSCLVASLTLCNMLTVVTHSIQVYIPDANEFTMSVDPVEKKLIFHTQFAVRNHGAYDIDDIDIHAKLLKEDNKELIVFSQNDLVVNRGSNRTFDVLINLDLDEVSLLDWFSLIYKNTVFKLVLSIDASYMFGLIDFTVDEVFEFPWTSPLYNITKDDEVVNSLYTLIDAAENDDIKNPDDMKDILSVFSLGDFEYESGGGYILKIKVEDSINNFKNVLCNIEVPFTDQNGKLSFDFTIQFGFENNLFSSTIMEVNINYVKV